MCLKSAVFLCVVLVHALVLQVIKDVSVFRGAVVTIMISLGFVTAGLVTHFTTDGYFPQGAVSLSLLFLCSIISDFKFE